MSKQDAEQLRQLVGFVAMSEPQRDALQRIAAQLESDAKRYDDSCKLQDIGKSAFESIAEMVAALECDYDRLDELKAQRMAWLEENPSKFLDPNDTRNNWGLACPDEAEELAELSEAAGECKSREDAEQRIMEDPLSLQMRGDWYAYDTEPADAAKPVEFELLLGTGGPATRIIGELDDHGQPTRARLQTQDWFLPWTDYIDGDSETLLTYCRCFYFGEG